MNAKNSAAVAGVQAGPAGPSKPSRGLAALDKLVAASGQHQRARRVAELDELARINRALHTLERSGGLSAAELLDMLTQTLGSAPAVDPASLLTSEQELALREAGSFAEQMPAFMARASTATALQGVSLVASSLTTGEVAEMVGLTESRIRQRATDRTLLAVRVGSTLRFPTFQFPDKAEIPGWDRVAPAFPAHAHPVAVETFMDGLSADLVIAEQFVSPTDWLAGGGDPQVVIDLVTTAFRVRA